MCIFLCGAYWYEFGWIEHAPAMLSRNFYFQTPFATHNTSKALFIIYLIFFYIDGCNRSIFTLSRRAKLTKYKSETIFQKISNTYPTIVREVWTPLVTIVNKLPTTNSTRVKNNTKAAKAWRRQNKAQWVKRSLITDCNIKIGWAKFWWVRSCPRTAPFGAWWLLFLRCPKSLPCQSSQIPNLFWSARPEKPL